MGCGAAGQHVGRHVDWCLSRFVGVVTEDGAPPQPGCRGLLGDRYCGAVEGEDGVMGEHSAQSSLQPPLGGEPRQSTSGFLERGDSCRPAWLGMVPLGGVGVQQAPHSPDGGCAVVPGRGVDRGPECADLRPDIADLERVQAAGAVHCGDQQDTALSGVRVAELSQGCAAVGAEQLVGDVHGFRAAEGVGLRLVDSTDPAGGQLVGDELIEQAGCRAFDAQA